MREDIMNTLWSSFGNIFGRIILLGVTIWVYIDAKALGDDQGRMPGIVGTKPSAWATGVFLILIIALPLYLVTRICYKRLLAERKAQATLWQNQEPALDNDEVWPPPPHTPAA